MGGLVVRAMLEDMCAPESIFKNYGTIPVNGKIPKIAYEACQYIPRVHTFITIATPHRGSPMSLPLWEK